MDGLTLGPTILWAQVPGTNPAAVPLLAFRRWYASLTLSSPEPLPSRFGLWAWLLGLSALLVLAILAQGPARALRQLFDVPGLVRLLAPALGRVRRASRLVAVLFGAMVLSWTAFQAISFSKPERKEDLAALLKTKSRGEVAVEQGELAALTPLRDLCGLGDTLILLVGASALVFKFSADRWGLGNDPGAGPAEAVPAWTTLCWGAAWLYVLYRFASLVMETDGLPLGSSGSCLFLDAAAVPALMALADGLILAWVLVELRQASPGADVGEGIDVGGAIALLPAATLACLAALPARYAAAASALILPYFQGTTASPTRSALSVLVRGWGLVGLQGAALTVAGLAGVVAWERGSLLRAYGRLLRADGGRLVALLALAGALGGGLAALAYVALLSLPPQPWVLAAADSYAHYATLLVGLVTLSALVELGQRAAAAAPALPEAAEDAGVLAA